MTASRVQFPNYPFSDQLYDFMDSHRDFYESLKLSNDMDFECIPYIMLSSTPPGHLRYRDQVIGMFYFDKTERFCNFHKGICLFKQDFVINTNSANTEFVSYSTSNDKGKYVRPIKEFFTLYGDKGKFYHQGSEWHHHYADIADLPNDQRLKDLAKKIKDSYSK
jgi:hypothetical protein